MSIDIDRIIANFKINTNSSKATIKSYVEVFLQKIFPNEAKVLSEQFNSTYESAIHAHEEEDQTDLSRLYRLLAEFKPSLTAILKPGKDFDSLCDIVSQQINITLDRVRRQINDEWSKTDSSKKGEAPEDKSHQLRYYCTVCKQNFDIHPEVQKTLLNSDEKIALPKHCDKELVIKIGQPEKEQLVTMPAKKQQKIEVYPAELVMQHINSAESGVEYLKLLSVGIVVGSSTTHLVFSRLTLERERGMLNMTNRFNLVEREILYKSNIIFTPLLDPTTIDVEAVIKFCKDEYIKAHITPEQVVTGAVIVTGETAKKKNAVEIVQRLASETGKFVSATAGHNYESVLACMGSGITNLSLIKQNTILNVDIGGGTSKLAIASRGTIHSTSAINVGGRLLGIDKNFKIWRIDGPARVVMKELGMNYSLGDTIPEKDVQSIAVEFAKSLVEVMQGPAQSPLAKKLMLTENLDFSNPINAISFSGGVAELIYELRAVRTNGSKRDETRSSVPFNDIGYYLVEQILTQLKSRNMPIIEPDFKIRATVIGAGAFSLSISGSTCYYDPKIPLPLTNIPIISISMNFNELLMGGARAQQMFKEKIRLALGNFNLVEGTDNFALYFNDLTIRADLPLFAKSLEFALPNLFAAEKLVVIILSFDGAKMLGITIRKETSLQNNLFCLDELTLENGDWIDIGKPFGDNNTFPITVKTLIFNKMQDDIQVGREKGQKSVSILSPQKVTDLTQTPDSTRDQKIPVREKIENAFLQLRANHKGYDLLIVLSPEGDIELITDKNAVTQADAKGILHAWKTHESAFTLGDRRFAILSWDETQFASQNVKTKQIIVGTRTKSHRYVLLKVSPGSLWEPNIASYAVKVLYQWAWDLI